MLPGITTCQASALEHRPQFFTSQGHLPTLLLASVPIVHFVGGRGLYLALVLGSLVSIIAMVGVLLGESGRSGVARGTPRPCRDRGLATRAGRYSAG